MQGVLSVTDLAFPDDFHQHMHWHGLLRINRRHIESGWARCGHVLVWISRNSFLHCSHWHFHHGSDLAGLRSAVHLRQALCRRRDWKNCRSFVLVGEKRLYSVFIIANDGRLTYTLSFSALASTVVNLFSYFPLPPGGKVGVILASIIVPLLVNLVKVEVCTRIVFCDDQPQD